ncbi:TPM domain-containing protein [Chelatococcus sambhunathii]|nr:TPM domain-containing protein [Chelatococcus sambhunathii]
MTGRRIILSVLGALLVLCAAAARADFTFPAFTNYVVDQANVIPPADEQALVAKLKAFQERSGHQLAIATVSSLQGTSVEDYGNRLFRDWKLGDKQGNDGALLLVAPNERKVRIEVGYGLEGDLTDAVSRLIIENAILPRFRAGDIPGGIARGADDVMAVFSGQAEDYKQRAAQKDEDAETPTIVTVFMICFWLFFLYVLWRSIRSGGSGVSRRRHGPWIIGGPGYGSGWGGGGGGWAGGGGGFGGGGGGSSGGGGASGGW